MGEHPAERVQAAAAEIDVVGTLELQAELLLADGVRMQAPKNEVPTTEILAEPFASLPLELVARRGDAGNTVAQDDDAFHGSASVARRPRGAAPRPTHREALPTIGALAPSASPKPRPMGFLGWRLISHHVVLKPTWILVLR